ncbi:MAG: Sterol desaturase [Labilithrix sp.]|nr:Sterol desaturase [Labilithrix sp.]
MTAIPHEMSSRGAAPGAGLVADARKGHLTEERRERVRARVLREIPWWYSPWGHLAATTGIGLTVLVVSVVQLAKLGARPSDWLVVPAELLLSNFFEWLVHKDVLHKRRWPFEVIYDKHTPMHHIMYVEEDMALRSTKEFRLVLIPAAGVLGIVLAATPLAIAISRLWSSSAGWLFLVTASLYMVTYEVLHLCYHAPSASFIGRLGFIRVMRAHHAHHHDPRLMQRWNFNVTVPLFDWVLRTVAPPRGGTTRRD